MYKSLPTAPGKREKLRRKTENKLVGEQEKENTHLWTDGEKGDTETQVYLEFNSSGLFFLAGRQWKNVSIEECSEYSAMREGAELNVN